MKFSFTTQFKKDLIKLKSENPKLKAKVLDLITSIDDTEENTLQGIGQPEASKNNLTGCFSGRVDKKHRLIYKYANDIVLLISCYGHYIDK